MTEAFSARLEQGGDMDPYQQQSGLRPAFSVNCLCYTARLR